MSLEADVESFGNGLFGVGAVEVLAHRLNLGSTPHAQSEKLHNLGNRLALAETDGILNLLVAHIVSVLLVTLVILQIACHKAGFQSSSTSTGQGSMAMTSVS